MRKLSFLYLIIILGCANPSANLSLAPAHLTNQSINFQYKVKGKPIKKLFLEVESLETYANLSLKENNQLLLDNLDIPDKGTYQFEVLVDFNNQGSKELTWQHVGGPILIKEAKFVEVGQIMIPKFRDISEEIGLKTELAWKYGGPTVADIDQNGTYDLIVNHHDQIPTQLFLQTEAGKLVEKEIFPWRADFHGMAAGDYDRDGDLDIIHSRGGGNGTNPQPPFLLRNDAGEFQLSAKEEGITQGARGRSVRWIDMDMDGDLDLMAANAKGIKDIDTIQHFFFENTGKEPPFKLVRIPELENAEGERVLVTDLNQDQISDLVLFSPLSIWLGRGDFTYQLVSESWLPDDLGEIDDILAATDIDIDNDGDLDVYLARGKEHYELANKSMDVNLETGRVDIRDEGNEAITAWEMEAEGAITLSGFFRWRRRYKGDFPIFLGAQKDTINDTGEVTETSQKSFEITPEMAQGWPEDRTENGWYIGHVAEGRWKMEWVRKEPVYWGIRMSLEGIKEIMPIGWQPNNRNLQDVLLRNDGDRFTDVSTEWNIPQGGNHWGVTTGDVNNDGHQDLYVYRFGFLRSRVTDWLLLNNGQGQFEMTTSHTARDMNDQGHGDMGQAFDFDLDGDIDLLSGSEDPGKWYLYGNETSSQNNSIVVRVGYSPTDDIDAYGAMVSVETADNLYQKRVGSAGEAYSQSLLNAVHFGLGKENVVKKITVRWRNGESIMMEDVAAGRVYDLKGQP